MNWQELKQERYQEYLQDIEIARKELRNMKLFPQEGVLCDLYAIPSHNYQAYYVMIYAEQDKLNMVYAKPQIYTVLFEEPIKMYPFQYAKEAKKHPSVDGHIVMGIEKLSSEFTDKIYDIVSHIPKEHILEENAIWIDGVFQAIRVFEGENVTNQVVYKSARKIDLPKSKEYLRNVLDDFYLEVGKMIEHMRSNEPNE